MSAKPLLINGVACAQCDGEFPGMREYLNHREGCEGRGQA